MTKIVNAIFFDQILINDEPLREDARRAMP